LTWRASNAQTDWQAEGGVDIMVQVRIPTPLRKYTGGAEVVQAEGATVGALLVDLDKRSPGIRERICDDGGAVRRFVNIFVNGEDIRFLQNLDTAVKAGDEVSVVPAIAGGC
jgi:molybdopterin synthase sulfur carrier subunit